MEFRNLKYNWAGSIDCEINHPRFGWIPFTASVDDPEPSTASIYAAIMESEEPIAPYEPPPPAPPVVPEVISDRQFFQALAQPPYELITQEEALAAVKTGDIPSAMMAILASMPENEKFSAEMLLSGATEFRRSHPLVGAFGAAMQWDDQAVDALFVAADGI